MYHNKREAQFEIVKLAWRESEQSCSNNEAWLSFLMDRCFSTMMRYIIYFVSAFISVFIEKIRQW